MRYSVSVFWIFCVALLTLGACGTEQNNNNGDTLTEEKVLRNKFPEFNADSAYAGIEKQLSFGYRIPGTTAHKACADWLFAQLKRYCDTVYFQKGTATTYDKKQIPVYNLIGAFNPAKIQRAMLASHWDSRPWGDNDNKDRDKPILAANDGASGVAVLLEMAKKMKTQKPVYGVDIVFFDAEDYGKSESENSFCLGSQYWGKNPHKAAYRAQFGVLLDMVGGKNATFYRENFSTETAGWVQNHLWKIADEMGYGNIFVDAAMGTIIDDHKYVYEATKIPMIDIIQYNLNSGFAPYWHTHADNMESVDKKTLQAVGNTLTAFVFNPPVTINP
jgi:hypothetical protein